MVLLDRSMDSYPYQMGKVPFTYYPYPCFHTVPHMKTHPPRVPSSYGISPYGGNYGYPSSCHGCCNNGYFPGSHGPYPQYSPPFAKFSHHGGYPQFPEPYLVPYAPDAYSIEQPIYKHEKNAPQCYDYFGYPTQLLRKGDEKPEVNEENDEVKNYPYPHVWFPNGYLKNKDRMKPSELNAKKLDGVRNEKSSENQPDGDYNRISYPVIWWPYDFEQEKAATNNHGESNYAEESAEQWPWHLRRKSGTNWSSMSSTPDLKKKSPDFDKTVESSCMKVNNQPCAHPVDKSKEANSNKKVRRIIEVTEMPGISPCNITVEKKSSHKPNTTKEETKETQIEERKMEEVLGTKMKKYNLSVEEAAVIIQSAYRGYEVRKLDLLNKLKKLDEIRKQAKEVEERIQSLSHPQIDAKQQQILEETIMRLLLNIDTIQGLPENLREIRKSVARGLTRMQEKLDYCSISVSEKFDVVKTEVLDQCIDTCNDECKGQEENEAKEIESRNELSDDTHKSQISDENESEMTVLDQITDYLCSITEKESHGEDQSGQKVMDVEQQTILNHCFSTDHERTTRASEAGLSELNFFTKEEKPEHEEGADQTSSPKSVLIFPVNGIPTEAKLVSDDSEFETQTEGEVLGGAYSSPIVADAGGAASVMIKDNQNLVKENEELRALVEKLVETTEEQSSVISDLNSRMHSLEKILLVKKKAVKGKQPNSRKVRGHQTSDQPDQEKPLLLMMEQSYVISDLNKKMHTLEKKLSVNQKAMRGKRPKSRMEHARKVYAQFVEEENDHSAQEERMINLMKCHDQLDQEDYYHQSS